MLHQLVNMIDGFMEGILNNILCLTLIFHYDVSIRQQRSKIFSIQRFNEFILI